MVEKSDLSSMTPSWLSQMYEPMRWAGGKVAEFFAPSSEAATTDSQYEVSVELPGVSDEDISVEVHDGRLTVAGEKQSQHQEEGKNFFFSERTYGKFQGVFRLPADADESKVSATHKDGVLTINIAKRTPNERGANSIPITRG
jgi:HSP20 family protein